MTLPAPNLDDRRFQELVDESKRMIQRRWPEWTGWTDHNVSDPGVTLIETFAYMVDQLIYRLNRVPDRNYVRFLEMVGITLRPPRAATTDVTFWLAAPQPQPVLVPEGTEVATERTEEVDPITFRTTEALSILPCTLDGAAVIARGGAPVDATGDLAVSREVALFGEPPQPGDAFYVGLDNPVPRCVVVLRFSGDVRGYGIDPLDPPRRWQAWTDQGWEECEIERDETGGFNRAGDVLIHIPRGHAPSSVGERRGGWLRCIIVSTAPGQRPYQASPKITGLRAFTVGGTAAARHAEEIRGEVLGTTDGVPGQFFDLNHRPLVFGGEPDVLELLPEGGNGAATAKPEEWFKVDAFPDEPSNARCFVVDPTAGRVSFPPAVRDENGKLISHGRVPAPGAMVRSPSYLAGGGQAGNVQARALCRRKTSIPHVTRCENRRAATGGVDGETVEQAKARAALALRTRERAVTASDFEYLSLQAAPEVARARCLEDAEPGGVVRVVVVPRVAATPDVPGGFVIDQRDPTPATLETIRASLDRRRIVGTRVVVEPPFYQGVTVVARVRGRASAVRAEVLTAALEAIHRYLHPVVGGPDGDGWPFGRPLQPGEVYTRLVAVPGVDLVDEVSLFTVDLPTGQRARRPSDRIELAPNGLFCSIDHQMRVD